MRRLVATLACALALTAAAPAGAQYWSTVGNQAGIGLNGILTAPMDPFGSVYKPPSALMEAPGAVVTGRFLGLFAGTLQCVYRLTMGVFDIVFAPIPSVMLSPEPRVLIFPGLEHEG